MMTSFRRARFTACGAAVAWFALQLWFATAQAPGRNRNALQSNSSLTQLATQQIAALAATGLGARRRPPAGTNATSSTAGLHKLLQQGVCAAAVTPQRQAACTRQYKLHQPQGVQFKDHQTHVSATKWEDMYHVLSTSMDPWLADELVPYLYDMDYELPHEGDPAAQHNHVWDPELRMTGELHCADATECVVPYLPELYYVGDEYMGGWALNGFDGEGLRSAIGPNIAPDDNPLLHNYTYIPYTQRILFAPAASLFFPYLVSIYAGDVYIAETDPFLLAITRAARAGIVEDYYYVQNYYTSYGFITTGVASAAVFAATARARGVIGTAIKLRNFNAVLASVARDDYSDRTRLLLLNSLGFVGASGGGYLFGLPGARNAFALQNPNVQIPYYAYDYSGASNPFPLQPATG